MVWFLDWPWLHFCLRLRKVPETGTERAISVKKKSSLPSPPPEFQNPSPLTFVYHIFIFFKLELILAALWRLFFPLFPDGSFLPSCSDLYKVICIIVILECPFTTLQFHHFLAAVLFCCNLFAGVYIRVLIGGKQSVDLQKGCVWVLVCQKNVYHLTLDW